MTSSPIHSFYPAIEGNDYRWFTSWRGEIKGEQRSWSGLKNIIHLVSATKRVNHQLTSLEPARVKWVSVPMIHQGQKAQESLEQCNFLNRLILKIVIFFCTGTTLNQQISKLEKAGGSTKSYKESLIKAAEEILNAEDGFEAYQSTAKDYPIPKRRRYEDTIADIRQPMHGILHHLQQALAIDGRKLIALLREKKSWDNPEVIELANSSMQLACLSYQLAMNYESQWLTEVKRVGSRAEAMMHQHAYPWLVVLSFDSLYRLIRGGAIINDSGKWVFTALDNNEETKRFYEEGTPQNQWRCQYNETIDVLDQEIGTKNIDAIDGRYMSGRDDQELWPEDAQAIKAERTRINQLCLNPKADLSLREKSQEIEKKWDTVYEACSVPQKWLLQCDGEELIEQFLTPC